MKLRRLSRRYLVFGAASVVVALSFVFTAWSLHERALEIDTVIYQQCVANELQDAVIVAQLEAAKARLEATIPNPTHPVRQLQEEILDDGISALEPPEESECQPPKGVDP
jgi:hypothetical protein